MFNIFAPLFLKYPAWIHPEIFPGIPVLGNIRWYGLMYVLAFGTAYFILRQVLREGALDQLPVDGKNGYKATEEDMGSFITWGIICLLIGARVFSTLVYDTTGTYWRKPWLIFWPFDPETKQFTGLAGMSYHGGFIGGFLGMTLWCIKHKRPVLRWIDAMAIAIPLGYTFGRLGNFFNGELFGRITTMPWGMVFPYAERFPTNQEWVVELCQKLGIAFEGQRFVNLPRHPSQLYEALFEGIILFTIIWNLRKKKPFDGFFTAIYTAGYGIFRFIIEYFREPDADLGYRISSNGSTELYKNTSLLNISTGQILCFLMIVFAVTITIVQIIRKKKGKCLEVPQWHKAIKIQPEKTSNKTSKK